MAELLAGYGVAVDQETMGTTTLHWCVRRRDHDLAQWLVEHGADPEAVGYKWNRAGKTPLALAEAAGHKKMTALLRDAAGGER